jgi:hypothetical protein
VNRFRPTLVKALELLHQWIHHDFSHDIFFSSSPQFSILFLKQNLRRLGYHCGTSGILAHR